MKTVGLIGGMSWESTRHYYTLLNQGISDTFGELHSAKIIMESVNFQPFAQKMQNGEWTLIGKELREIALRIQNAGADCLLLCTNTMHKVAQEIESSISIPFLHIADSTGQKIEHAGVKLVGLLGTRFTMEESFYKERLEKKYGLTVITPDQQDRQIVDRVIFEELCKGKILDSSRQEYLRIIDIMNASGVEAVIEGCTEISMLVNDNNTSTPLYDTTTLHVESALEFVLK